VADRGQQDVAAGLVGLGLQREADAVALVLGVLRDRVDGLAVAVEGRADVLRRVGLGALAAAPHDERLRAELGGQVDVAQHLAQRVPADAAVVAGEAAVLEDRVGEQVRGHHGHGQTGRVDRLAEQRDPLVALAALGAERDEVVVVQRDAPRAEVGQLVHGLDRVEHRAGRVTERVARLPADRPQAEAEPVLASGLRCHGSSSNKFDA
jgi:hypothetical protein